MQPRGNVATAHTHDPASQTQKGRGGRLTTTFPFLCALAIVFPACVVMCALAYPYTHLTQYPPHLSKLVTLGTFEILLTVLAYGAGQELAVFRWFRHGAGRFTVPAHALLLLFLAGTLHPVLHGTAVYFQPNTDAHFIRYVFLLLFTSIYSMIAGLSSVGKGRVLLGNLGWLLGLTSTPPSPQTELPDT